MFVGFVGCLLVLYVRLISLIKVVGITLIDIKFYYKDIVYMRVLVAQRYKN